MVNITDLNFTAPSVNFTNFQQNLIEWSIQGYTSVFGGFFWAILLTGVIVYVFIKNSSAVTAVVAIIIIMAGFGTSSVMLQIQPWVMLMQLVTALGIAGLVVVYFTRSRNRS